jgi:hypothetical protein
MFHVELRQFPSTGRAFNLSVDELRERVLGPWLSGRPVELNERRFSPQKAKLTIYEGRRLGPEEIGLGRGWANVTRSGQEVTQRILSQARQTAANEDPLTRFKQELMDALEVDLPVRAVLALADERYPGTRASERLALAERAVWELLHAGAIELTRNGGTVAPEEWQPLLLAWETWTQTGVLLRPGAQATTSAMSRARSGSDANR